MGTGPIGGLILHSEMGSRHEDEKNAECHSDGGEDEERHCRSRPEEPSNERLSNTRPVHKGVFAEAEEGHNQVELILVADQKVRANREGQDELWRSVDTQEAVESIWLTQHLMCFG